jgi:two-component system response regulator RegA
MSESAHRASILVVDDDDVFRGRLARAFTDRDFEVVEATDHDEAVAAATRESPEYAVVDLRMPGRSGLELVQALKRIDAATKVVVLTGYGSIATALDAVRLGATHYLTKPADADEILKGFHRDEQGADAPPSPLPDEVPSLARVEWEHINRVLADCQGNISEAARRLGVHRRSLQRKLSKYPVSR